MAETKRILFIGDSITEWGRQEDPENLGDNYVRIIHDYLTVTYPEINLKIINKSIGGNRVTDLLERWEKDVIAYNPDIISISIGINEVWRQLDQPEMEQVYPAQFAEVYENLLVQIKEKTKAKMILFEPTVMGEEVDSEGNKVLIPYVEATRKLAEKYQATIIPTHETFMEYLRKGGHYHLTTDGVHMNPAGNMLMAKSWLEVAVDLLE